jgi:hypothetical protein
MSFYSRAHYQRVSPPSDTREQIQERLIRNQACEKLGVADRQAKYPVLTESNAQEAIDYQDERIRFHHQAISRRGPISETAPDRCTAGHVRTGKSAGRATDGHESARQRSRAR